MVNKCVFKTSVLLLGIPAQYKSRAKQRRDYITLAQFWIVLTNPPAGQRKGCRFAAAKPGG